MTHSETNQVIMKFAKGETCRTARAAMLLGYLQAIDDVGEMIRDIMPDSDIAEAICIQLAFKREEPKRLLKKV